MFVAHFVFTILRRIFQSLRQILSHKYADTISAFDPVKYNKRNGDFKEALEPYATFHNWGLGTEDQARKDSMYKTVKKTMAELGHTGKTIDIFVRDFIGLIMFFEVFV
jgi:hypothetical protein